MGLQLDTTQDFDRKGRTGVLIRFGNDTSGGFAIMAGAVLSMVCVGGLFGLDSYYRVMKVKKFDEYVRAACYRAIKPTRNQILSDEDRQMVAQDLANRAFPANLYDNLEVDVSLNWLTANVTASADFEPALHLLGNDAVSVAASFDCEGIPPYPEDNEDIMAMEFTNEQGRAMELPKHHGSKGAKKCWGVTTHEAIGWSGSKGWDYGRNVNNKNNVKKEKDPNKQSGGNRDNAAAGQIEIQFWGTPPGLTRSDCFDMYPPLPSEAPSEYGIELDAHNNNEIWRNLELHPGHYSMTVWYFPRGYTPSDARRRDMEKYGNKKYDHIEYWDTITNGIGIYLTGLRGENATPKTPVICMSGKTSEGWKKYTYNFRLDEYNIYQFSVKGEQANDTIGGVFNSFQVKYLDDLNTRKEFINEYHVGQSLYSGYKNCTEYLDKDL